MHTHLSIELSLKAFEANAAFSAALAEFQKAEPCPTVIAEARRAAAHGFSWFCRPSEPGFVEVRLRHAGGAENSAEGTSISALLAGLLGHPLAQDLAVLVAAQAAEPEQEEITVSEVQAFADALAGFQVTRFSPAQEEAAVSEVLDPQPQPVTGAMVAASLAAAVSERLTAAIDALPPSPAQVAAESLTAATGGAVITEPSEYVPDPDELLTDASKTACVNMIKALTAEQRRLFTISFRDAFKIDREIKAIAPLITQIRHWDFCERWRIEATGGVAA